MFLLRNSFAMMNHSRNNWLVALLVKHTMYTHVASQTYSHLRGIHIKLVESLKIVRCPRVHQIDGDVNASLCTTAGRFGRRQLADRRLAARENFRAGQTDGRTYRLRLVQSM